MKEPTKEQIKEFWKKCGFVYKDEPFTNDSGHKGIGRTFYYPNGQVQGYSTRAEGLPCYPIIDLNNLFKYAVQNMALWKKHRLHKRVRLLRDWADTLGGHPTVVDPALALFWAIWKVIK